METVPRFPEFPGGAEVATEAPMSITAKGMTVDERAGFISELNEKRLGDIEF